MAHKYVYLFSEGNGTMRELLGGKGANLAEMTVLGTVSYTHLSILVSMFLRSSSVKETPNSAALASTTNILFMFSKALSLIQSSAGCPLIS